MIVDLLLITIIVCFIVDISGVVEQVKRALVRFVSKGNTDYDFSFKPFDCSLCMTWWCGIIYIAIYGHFNLCGLLCCALFAFAADTITSIMTLAKDLIGAFINRIYDKLQ